MTGVPRMSSKALHKWSCKFSIPNERTLRLHRCHPKNLRFFGWLYNYLKN